MTDYGVAEDRDADRLLRMGQAWSIFSRFIVDGAVWNIGEFVKDISGLIHLL